MWKCPKCNDYRFNNVKECHCKEFTVVDDDGDEYSIYGMDEESVALKYAQQSNENYDYYLMDATVKITVNGKGYKISAEPDVHYSANEI